MLIVPFWYKKYFRYLLECPVSLGPQLEVLWYVYLLGYWDENSTADYAVLELLPLRGEKNLKKTTKKQDLGTC